ncbi:hypothetical protein [Photorhabdus khanii]|nr:hypothetical protein [Photorhabdus khanii]
MKKLPYFRIHLKTPSRFGSATNQCKINIHAAWHGKTVNHEINLSQDNLT